MNSPLGTLSHSRTQKSNFKIKSPRVESAGDTSLNTLKMMKERLRMSRLEQRENGGVRSALGRSSIMEPPEEKKEAVVKTETGSSPFEYVTLS